VIEKKLPLDDLPPALETVLGYWRGLGGAALQCGWSDFHLDQLPPASLPTTLVVDVMPNARDNVYRFWGTGLTWIHGVDLTSRTTAELPPPELAEVVIASHATTADDGVASASIFGFERFGGFDHMHSVLRLPLSNDGETVNQIVVVIDLTNEGRAEIKRQQLESPG